MATTTNNEVTSWIGWVYFAGFMMLILGVFQAIAGLVGLLNNTFYVAARDHLVAFNVTAWGWVDLIIGIVVICAGIGVFSGSTWARAFGIFLASLNLISQFAFVNAYPIWSIIMMIVDVLIIYALTVHGAEARAARG